MTPPSAADRPGTPGGTERMRFDARGSGGAGVAPPSAAGPRSLDGDTGPVPVVGDRPEPAGRSSGEIPAVPGVAAPEEPAGEQPEEPAEEADVPTTERKAGGRAG